MKLRTNAADRALAAGMTLLLMLLGGMAWGAYGNAATLPFVAVCAGFVFFIHLESMRRSDAAVSRLKSEAVNDFRQVESLLYLISLLQPDPPLPDTRDGAPPATIGHMARHPALPMLHDRLAAPFRQGDC